MTLHLVRHGLPVLDPQQRAADWQLDPAGFDDIWALHESGRLPQRAAWFCSPEPKAQHTGSTADRRRGRGHRRLREHKRGPLWIEDFQDHVRAAFVRSDQPAAPGWEPLDTTRARLVPAVLRILAVHGDDDVVLVGHGTAWTLLVAELTGSEPDLQRWRSLAMPDVITAPSALR